jgi:hypothetical protein
VEVRFLDFGYRPWTIGRFAFGREIELLRHHPRPNPRLEDMIVNYATCWPLIAAASIKVKHDGDPFAHEYIVPQMILQWLIENSDCHGIRYFSTRKLYSDPSLLHGTINYVFPASHLSGPQVGYSQRLKDMFEYSDPEVWGARKKRPLENEMVAKQAYLATLSKSALR